MAGWLDGAWWDGDWWGGEWWLGGGVDGGGGLPEQFAFSIKNQRVSNHAAAAQSAIDMGDSRVAAVHAQVDAHRKKMMLDAKEEEDMILLLMFGFE